MTYTAWFDEIRKGDIALAGGKGANLGELSQAGLPVPPGFVVTTTAYDAFVEASGIKGEVVALASVPPTEDPAAFEEVAGGIRTLFSGGHVPEEMAEEIRAAYHELGQDAIPSDLSRCPCYNLSSPAPSPPRLTRPRLDSYARRPFGQGRSP